MSRLITDLRLAFRSLPRTPGFAVTSILFLTFGLGLNTALFSMVDAVLLRGLPLGDPSHLVEVFGVDSGGGSRRVAPAMLEAVTARSTSISALTIHGPVGATLRSEEGPIDVRGDHTSSTFEQVYGVPAFLGRTFRAGEDAPGAAPVVVVSHAFWKRFLNGDSVAIGKSIVLDSTAYTVIGVMPPSFQTNFRADPEFYWTPQINAQTLAFESEEGYEIVARLKPHVDLATFRREITTIAAGAGVPGWSAKERRLETRSLQNEVVGASARVVVLAFGAVALILVITCANIALLSLSRSDARIGEFATRKALGGSNVAIMRLAFAESLVLAIIGGILGSVAAYVLLPSMISLAPAMIPRLADATIDVRVLGAAFGLVLISACGAGMVPALRLARLSPSSVIGGSSARVSSRSGFRSALVVAQIAGAIVLCVLAGLVTRTLQTLASADIGFEARGANVFLVYASPRVYPDAAERSARINQVVERLSNTAGIDAVTIADNPPFTSNDATSSVALNGATSTAERVTVMPNYFDVMRVPVVAGRTFANERPADARVAVVSKALARKIGGEANLIGQRVRVGNRGIEYEVIGIAADVRTNGTTAEAAPVFYASFRQVPSPIVTFVTRSSLPARDVEQLVRKEIRAAFPVLPLALVPFAHRLDDLVRRSMAAPRFLATFANILSAAALALSATGVFGLVAYSVSRRRRELGIRAALGAQPWDLAAGPVRQVLALSTAGIVIGVACALYLSRFVESQLYGISRFDVTVFSGAAIVLLITTGIAAAIPSRRAARMDPASVLRL